MPLMPMPDFAVPKAAPMLPNTICIVRACLVVQPSLLLPQFQPIC
jgi:hypothetical protein